MPTSLWLVTSLVTLSVLVDASPLTLQAAEPLASLEQWLATPSQDRESLASQSWSQTSLTAAQAATAQSWLWEDYCKSQTPWATEVLAANQVSDGEFTMKFDLRTFGDAPQNGHSLYLSLHGGGGAPTAVNDSQWKNQQRLYELTEGIYIAPRAPTDTWNLWHQAHIDGLFQQIIKALVVTKRVDPNRVYVMGYSAGGDGVYQLGPRMADTWAAAAMMAGHPNEASPLNLRNIGFTIHMGALDGAYDRNKVAKTWGDELDRLQTADPDGYAHETIIHEGKGHWMDRQDAVALDYMAKFTRNPNPKRVIWRQDDVTHQHFYWLAIPSANGENSLHAGQQVIANIDGQTIDLETTDITHLTLRLNDQLVDLDQEVVIRSGGKQLFCNKMARTIEVLLATMLETSDPNYAWPASVDLIIPPTQEP
jgi:predicted esterase